MNLVDSSAVLETMSVILERMDKRLMAIEAAIQTIESKLVDVESLEEKYKKSARLIHDENLQLYGALKSISGIIDEWVAENLYEEPKAPDSSHSKCSYKK